jgi:hypothetical protein
MPEGEEMFFYHGYSGPCPKPPKPEEPKHFHGECSDCKGHPVATEEESTK